MMRFQVILYVILFLLSSCGVSNISISHTDQDSVSKTMDDEFHIPTPTPRDYPPNDDLGSLGLNDKCPIYGGTGLRIETSPKSTAMQG